MEEETQHADAILRRLLMLGGKPDMRPLPFTPGETVAGDACGRTWQTEYSVRQHLQDAIALCARPWRLREPRPPLAQLRDTEEHPRLLAGKRSSAWIEKVACKTTCKRRQGGTSG